MRALIGVAAVVIVLGSAAVAWLGGEEGVVRSDPVPISARSPFDYPIELWDQRVEGETVLMVRVTEAGAVDTSYVLVSSGESAFDSAAIAGSRDLRFEPARQGEDRVAMWVRLPVRFRLPAAGPTNGGD
ncbi:MAG TPA: energy transducer TonB [Longimicrobiales bacterium]|nr:energy transducer TonB [Longimicrobiales bacterium]